MKALKLKICGLRDHDNIREVAALRPDFMGFIFHPPSPRYVGETFRIPADLDASIKKVGVFVNERPSSILEKTSKLGMEYVQLHGDESPKVAEELKREGLNIIKVLRIGDAMDNDLLRSFDGIADYFLFDTRGNLFGGNALKFDWGLLNDYSLKTPFFLSGGITADDVMTIEQTDHPYLFALDLNSGVEEVPGKKDLQKVSAAITNIRKVKN